MNQQKPLVSVIIPTHNSANFISRCIDSVQNQSEKSFEIIAVDDQSSDATKEILKRYELSFRNFKFLETPERLMAGGARNIGIDAHKGKYISFIDSDDWIDTNYLHYMLSSTDETDSDVVVCGVKREYPNAKDSSVRYRYNKSNVITGNYALSLLSRIIDQDIAISAIPTNKLFKSEFIQENNLRFIPNSRNEDDVFMFFALLHANQVSITDKTYYHLFQRPDSISRSFSQQNISDLMKAFEIIRDQLEARGVLQEYKQHYYSFFEKCFQYLLETMLAAESDESRINDYLKFTFNICHKAISVHEFIEHCGYRRIGHFFQ